jgi:hypothetical protein
MALILKDRVQETSTTTGTGTLTLAGAVTQFQTFSSAVGNGNTTYYTIYNAGGTQWEVGLGTVGAGTLSRDTVLSSSNANALVSFTGTLYVFGDYPAGKAVYANAAGNIENASLTTPKIDLINDTNGNEILGLSPTTSATDYLVVKNGIGVGVPLHVYADGSSTNTGLHIQPKGTGLVTISDGLDFNKGIRFRSSSSAASAITLLDAVATAGRVVTLPDATTTLVGRDTTDTLTNKTISGATNTLSNIGNASLTNSAITINGTSTSLGGSISVGSVTAVSATAPITSSGGATPDIAMPAATTAVSGYLTSTDWTTFNNKGSGTVTAVSITSANGFAGSSSGGATPALTISTSITGVLKGNGTAISAATAGTDYVAPGTATTFTATQSFTGSTSVLATILTNAAEVCTVSATAATGTIAYYPSTQSVLYYTSNASANWTINLAFSSGTSMNTAMTTGQSLTVAFLVTQGATAYYNNVVQVDGTTSGVTTRWQGGAPTKGNASGIDVYTYTIIKTGSATFTVLASQTQFKA